MEFGTHTPFYYIKFELCKSNCVVIVGFYLWVAHCSSTGSVWMFNSHRRHVYDFQSKIMCIVCYVESRPCKWSICVKNFATVAILFVPLKQYYLNSNCISFQGVFLYYTSLLGYQWKVFVLYTTSGLSVGFCTIHNFWVISRFLYYTSLLGYQ
jgi:hypothetical protein